MTALWLALGLLPAAAAPPDLVSAAEPVAPAAASSTPASPGPDATVLSAPPPADAAYERLLGDDPPSVDLGTPPAGRGVGAGLAGLWPLGIAVAGAGLVWLARKRTPGLGGSGSDGPWVVGRTALGSGTQAVLLEVRDAAGRNRRLLVATGSAAPTLLADLGEDEAETEAAAAAPEPALPRAVLRGREAAMSLIDEVVAGRRGPEVGPAVARDRYTAGSR